MSTRVSGLWLAVVFGCVAMGVHAAAEGAGGMKGQQERRIIAVAGEKATFLIASGDGTLKPLALPKGTRCGSGAGAGSDDPVLSPDGRSVALIQDGVLRIQPVAGGRGVVASARYPNEMFLITGWAPDGQSVIYHLSPPEGEEPAPSKIEQPQHFVYEVGSARTWEIHIPGSLVGWLPDGAMLIRDDGDGGLHSQALVKGAVSKQLVKPEVELGQVFLHPDGGSVAAASNRRNDTSSSQLIKLELASGKITPLREPGGWADFQWPKWNSSGKRIAWLERTGSEQGIVSSVVAVDGKPVCEPAVIYEYHWLGEDALVIMQDKAVVVIDAQRKELARHGVERGGE